MKEVGFRVILVLSPSTIETLLLAEVFLSFSDKAQSQFLGNNAPVGMIIIRINNSK